MAKVSPSMASGLEELIEYDKPDVAEVYTLNWPRAEELPGLPREGRQCYVEGFVEWYFEERFHRQWGPFCEGFGAVVGHSRLMQKLVTPAELEQIICGVEEPLDVPLVRASSKPNGWNEEDEGYLTSFWDVVESFSEEERHRFAVFVSASSRMPLKGWSDFHLQVQKDGTLTH